MARIVGGITTSHNSAIADAINKGIEGTPYWKRFFDGYQPVAQWLDRVDPDVAIVVYSDHGLNFFLDNMPTFAMGAAAEYSSADEGRGLPVCESFTGDPEFSWHLIESLIGQDFDLAICQEMLVDHGFVVPMSLLWRHKSNWPVKVIPLMVNTVQHPLARASRCHRLGKALRIAVESYPEDLKVVVIGTGGMSHQLQGERAGIIDVDFDMTCLNKMVDDPVWLTRFSNKEIIDRAGTEGIEIIMWLVMRGALDSSVELIHKHYHAPISNTGAGVLVLESVT